MIKEDFGSTVSPSAIRDEREKLVELVLENGVNIDAKNEAGDTALHWAIRGNLVKLIAKLVGLPPKEHAARR